MNVRCIADGPLLKAASNRENRIQPCGTNQRVKLYTIIALQQPTTSWRHSPILSLPPPFLVRKKIMFHETKGGLVRSPTSSQIIATKNITSVLQYLVTPGHCILVFKWPLVTKINSDPAWDGVIPLASMKMYCNWMKKHLRICIFE